LELVHYAAAQQKTNFSWLRAPANGYELYFIQELPGKIEIQPD
jgi:hypothetical protein